HECAKYAGYAEAPECSSPGGSRADSPQQAAMSADSTPRLEHRPVAAYFAYLRITLDAARGGCRRTEGTNAAGCFDQDAARADSDLMSQPCAPPPAVPSARTFRCREEHDPF